MNEIFDQTLHGQIISYADDTALVVSAKTWEDLKIKISSDINMLKIWFNNNLLTMNSEKTYIVPFSIHSSDYPTNMNVFVHSHEPARDHMTCDSTCSRIKISNSVKYLGIILDWNLKWKEQIEAVVKRLRKLVYIFLEIRNFMNVDQLYSVYFGLVQSILQYSVTSWGAAYNTSLKCVDVAQKLIIKILLGKPRDFPTELLFKTFRVPRLNELFKKCAILQVLREPEHHTFLVHNRTRNRYVYVQAKRHTTFSQHHYAFLGERYFNELPLKIRKIENHKKMISEIKKMFKSKLQNH
jgi:hypothetical protein